MWNGNGHHHSENGDDNRNGSDPTSNDPARFAAVSALAAFSQGAAYPPAPQQQQHSSNASHLAVDSTLSYQEQALRQQALYAFQNQQQHPHSAHPMHHATPQQQQQQQQQQLEYSRQMAGRHDAEQFQRMQQGQQQQQQQQHQQQHQQQQQWGNDRPPTATMQQHPDVDTATAGSMPSNSRGRNGNDWARTEQEQASDDQDNDPAVAAETLDEGTDDDEAEEAVAMEHEDEAMDVDGEDPDNSDTGSRNAVEVPAIVPRGKPEAMAVKLAAAAMEETREDLDAEAGRQESDAEVVAEVEGEAEALIDESDNVVVAKVEKPKPNRSRSIPKKSRKKAPPPTSERSELLLSENTPGITDEEYENLEALMIQFCRVPLLAEFSRPVTLLHPEVS
jgi:hypothetical protein